MYKMINILSWKNHHILDHYYRTNVTILMSQQIITSNVNNTIHVTEGLGLGLFLWFPKYSLCFLYRWWAILTRGAVGQPSTQPTCSILLKLWVDLYSEVYSTCSDSTLNAVRYKQCIVHKGYAWPILDCADMMREILTLPGSLWMNLK